MRFTFNLPYNVRYTSPRMLDHNSARILLREEFSLDMTDVSINETAVAFRYKDPDQSTAADHPIVEIRSYSGELYQPYRVTRSSRSETLGFGKLQPDVSNFVETALRNNVFSEMLTSDLESATPYATFQKRNPDAEILFNVRDHIINLIHNKIKDFINIDGLIWVKTGEPLYVYSAFGDDSVTVANYKPHLVQDKNFYKKSSRRTFRSDEYDVLIREDYRRTFLRDAQEPPKTAMIEVVDPNFVKAPIHELCLSSYGEEIAGRLEPLVLTGSRSDFEILCTILDGFRSKKTTGSFDNLADALETCLGENDHEGRLIIDRYNAIRHAYEAALTP